MEDKIREIIERKINPILSEHYGGAELVEVIENIVYIRMLGACGACPSSQVTVETIIESLIKEAIPEIEGVTICQMVSEDLIDLAKKILR